MAIVAYDDDDPENTRGLINSEIFNTCWERQGKPIDFFAFEESTQSDNVFTSPKFATEPIVQPETSYYSRNYKTEVETENATSNTAVSISGVKNNQEKDKHPLWRLENKLYGK